MKKWIGAAAVLVFALGMTSCKSEPVEEYESLYDTMEIQSPEHQDKKD